MGNPWIYIAMLLYWKVSLRENAWETTPTKMHQNGSYCT
jgi:hypothetical protein